MAKSAKKAQSTYKVVFLRHGESEWNASNQFSGWHDVDLTPLGEEQARNAGKELKKAGYVFDIVYDSVLKRSVRTSWLVLREMDLVWIPIHKHWRLNERHYGALQGLNKSETAQKYGEEQVLKWRRSYDIRPPQLTKKDPEYPGYDPKYKHLDDDVLPFGECLKDTVERVMPYWNDTIIPEIKDGKMVLVSAHGNSLRAIIAHLDNMSPDAVVHLNIPTGVPLVYEFDKDFNPITHYYLGDKDKIEAQINAVAAQGKTEPKFERKVAHRN